MTLYPYHSLMVSDPSELTILRTLKRLKYSREKGKIIDLRFSHTGGTTKEVNWFGYR